MAAVWYRLMAELRTRWRAWSSLVLLIGVAAGAVIALAAAAIVLANLVAMVPAWLAARTKPAVVLRAE
ncbi:MAG: hypothetical protein H0V95_14995 [Actinobacteria bacterium]|nr:hypothetical protein [Actinomycetota bacterium]